MMRLLEQRVPLTLLLDLMVPPDAAELYRLEGGGADLVDHGLTTGS
jgi:hypothetical protein